MPQPRTPLAPRSANIVKKPHLTPFERGTIYGQRLAGCTISQIAEALNTSESTVKYTLYKTIHNENQEDKPHTGRPKRMTSRERRSLIRTVRSDPSINYSDLKENLGTNVSTSTLYREIKTYGLTNWLAKKRPLLTPEVAAKRYAWAKAREDWGPDKWQKIIWSDECSVERGTGKNRKWVFRFPNEKWLQNMVQPVPKGRGISVMVWGAFYHHTASHLMIMKRDPAAKRNGYTAASYCDILDQELLGFLQPDLQFMQDNAPIHTATVVKRWFEQHDLKVLEWPPYSPDLNPIEHLWFCLKKLVYEVNPDIEKVTGGVEKVKEALSKALEEAWRLIEADLLEKLVRSMPKRINAVITSEGWYTKY